MVKALHHTSGKFAATQKREKILKPVWGVEDRQQSHSQLTKKLRAARNSQARLQSVGASANSEPSLQKKPSVFLLESGAGTPLRWASAAQPGDTRSKAEEELEPIARSALQEEWTSLEKRNPQTLVDPVLAKWNSTDSGYSSPRKRKFRELSRFAPSSIPIRRTKSGLKDLSSSFSGLLNSPIIGNRELTEEEESVVGKVSVLLNEDPIVVVAIDPLIIEVAYLQKEFTSDRTLSRPKSLQSSQPKLKPLDEESPHAKLDCESSEPTGDTSDSKELRVKHKIVVRPKIASQDPLKQHLPADFIPPGLEPEFEISKKKIIGTPGLDSHIVPNKVQIELSNLCTLTDQTQTASLLDAPQAKRAAPVKPIEASTLVSWTLIGKRMTPVFQDVQINRWPSVSERKADPKGSNHPLITNSAGKSKGSAIAEAHPWQSLLKDFGPSFDESSDEDLIQKGIVFMKKQLHSGIRDLERKNIGETRNMDVVNEILLTPIEVTEGKNPSLKTKATKQKVRPSLRESMGEVNPLRQTLSSTVAIESVNLQTMATVQHCSAAELSGQQPGPSSQPGSLCDSSEELSLTSSPHCRSPPPVHSVLSVNCLHLLAGDSAEDEFL